MSVTWIYIYIHVCIRINCNRFVYEVVFFRVTICLPREIVHSNDTLSPPIFIYAHVEISLRIVATNTAIHVI